MQMGLTDKVIVVTGAASGIGLAVAQALADESVGGQLRGCRAKSLAWSPI